MDFGKQMCYASPGITINVLGSRVRAQKCCIVTKEIPVDKIETIEDLDLLNDKLHEFIVPTNNIICNGLSECIKMPVKNLTVNAAGCNIKCYMCPCSAPPDKETKETYFKTLEKIRNFKLDWLYLSTGGEPFIWKKETLDYILSLTEDTTKNLDITTNGILLNKEDIEKLAMSKINVKVAVSISGITESVYSEIHSNPNFYKVLENTLLLKEAGVLRNINVVVCKYNISSIEEILKFWQEKGIAVSFLTVRNEENIEETEQFKLFKKRWPNYDLIQPADLPAPLVS